MQLSRSGCFYQEVERQLFINIEKSEQCCGLNVQNVEACFRRRMLLSILNVAAVLVRVVVGIVIFVLFVAVLPQPLRII